MGHCYIMERRTGFQIFYHQSLGLKPRPSMVYILVPQDKPTWNVLSMDALHSNNNAIYLSL
uniref:Uncharacterized protein n=1 Tax=Nelumbo nucifera TaxID=4432 RepID=A0A822YTY5_NELNU|nr:TPA_asm: hypothetical protein HUJ06_005509 [Nelumbo nucifera]